MAKQRCLVGIYVEVEVDAWPQEAGIVAEHACGFPGDWQPPHDRVRVQGEINGNIVYADLIRSRVLSVQIKQSGEAKRVRDCIHGQLRRKCDICALGAEVNALTDELLSLVADLIGDNWCFFCGWTPTHRADCRLARIMRERGVSDSRGSSGRARVSDNGDREGTDGRG